MVASPTSKHIWATSRRSIRCRLLASGKSECRASGSMLKISAGDGMSHMVPTPVLNGGFPYGMATIGPPCTTYPNEPVLRYPAGRVDIWCMEVSQVTASRGRCLPKWVAALVAVLGLGVAGLAVWPAMAATPVIGSYGNAQVFVAWAAASLFVIAGAVALARPSNARFGWLLVVTGLVAAAGHLVHRTEPGALLVGVLMYNAYLGVLVHALLAFPSGTLSRGRLRVLAAFGYLATAPAWAYFFDSLRGCPFCGHNPFDLGLTPPIGVAQIVHVQAVLTMVILAATATVVARRWWYATRVARRAFTPVLASGFVALVLGATTQWQVQVVGPLTGSGLMLVAEWIARCALLLVPVAFLIGLARSELTDAGTLRTLLDRLGRATHTGNLQRELSEAFEDETLELAYRLPNERGYVDASGLHFDIANRPSNRATTLVRYQDETVGAIVHDAALDPVLVRAASAAAGLALASERLTAELRAAVREAQQSRRRIVEAADAERRRIERNLHDGAQQHLLSVILSAQRAGALLPDDPPAAATLLTSLQQQLDTALHEIRELARGIHPAGLTERGLAAALSELAGRATVGVTIKQLPDGRLPAMVEAAAYFIAAEAITNVARHSGTNTATLRVWTDGARLLVEVRDSGCGGAEAARGSGLAGLADRAAAVGGTLEVVSIPDQGTRVRAELPCAS